MLTPPNVLPSLLVLISIRIAGMLLAVGDHRGSSLDGRFFGLIEESDVYGRAVGIYRRKGEGIVWRPL